MEGKRHIADRMADIDAFYVMDVLARARSLEAKGRSIIHLEIGEPDYLTPPAVIEAGINALRNGKTHYTPALGLPALRQAIADYYHQTYAVDIPSSRVVITPGASGALQLVLGVLINPGDEVLMADPGYPCNRHFVRLFEGRTNNIAVGAESGYQLNADLIARHWGSQTRAVMVASPSNPTGTQVDAAELHEMVQMTQLKGGQMIVDEIYQGLIYEGQPHSILQSSDVCFVINSFSKYFSMTGWRVGWMVVPEGYERVVDKLAQNIFLAASTPAQYAALAAFEPETMAIYEERRLAFKARRDYLMPALQALGFEISCQPQGAFYLYANCSRFTNDSYAFAMDVLEKAGVAITPGRDFGRHQAEQHVRFAYTNTIDKLEEAVKRLANYLS